MHRSSNNVRREPRRERLVDTKGSAQVQTVLRQSSGRKQQYEAQVERLGKEGDRTTPSRDLLPLSKIAWLIVWISSDTEQQSMALSVECDVFQ